ncbi:MAG: hypothetical protein GC134_03835 [Proteobacteria bacterium]|nr:hypothetical protein [Pseudomonadota bacterium]
MDRYPSLMRLQTFRNSFPSGVRSLARELNDAHPHPTDKRRKLFGNSQDILLAIDHLQNGRFEDTAAFGTIDAANPYDLLLAVYRRIMSVDAAIAAGKIPPSDREHILAITTWLMGRYHDVDWTKPRPRVTVRIKPVFDVSL